MSRDWIRRPLRPPTPTSRDWPKLSAACWARRHDECDGKVGDRRCDCLCHPRLPGSEP